MKKLLYLSVIAIIFAACQNNSGYTIQGNVSNEEFEGEKVYFEKWDDSIKVIIDSTVVKDNEFVFIGETKTPVLGFITIGDKRNNINTMLMVEPGEINLKYNEGLYASGTKINNAYSEYKTKQKDFDAKSRAIIKQRNDALSDSTLTDELNKKLETSYFENQDESKASTISFIKENIDNELGHYLFRTSSRRYDIDERKEILALVSEEHKSTTTIKGIISQIEIEEAVAIGKDFIDFTMKNPEGESISLSDFAGKGKYVFIDFWAAWCGPCIGEMPNVVEAYEKYKDKGLEIVGVSLDSDKENWISRIESLNMTWPQMSDLNGWKTEAARLYAVSAIPHTVLLDKEGKIIAKNLRGEELQEKLAELLD